MTKAQCKKRAYQAARDAGLDTNTADAVARRVADMHDDEFQDREVDEFIREEISKHANP
jgi:hypothetical protein